MRMPKIESKVEYFPIVGGDIKATNDDKGIIEGYLNYIGNIDYGDDRTMKGAFRNTIRDSFARKSQQGLDYLWPYLWNHDYSQLPPGGIFDADETSKGLYIKTQFNLDIQMGRELYSSFKVGTMKKQSMGYKALQVEYVKDKDVNRTIRNLLEVAVMEGSAVVFPMNDMAQVDTVKNLWKPRNWQGFSSNGAKMKMTPPRKDKGAVMDIWAKDYAESYQQTNQQDWVSDLWNLWYPLRNEIIQAFVTGDTPVEDVQKALDQFSTATLAYVQQGVALDMTEYLQPDDDDNGMMPGMYMSADDNPETKEVKEGRVLSATNHAKLTKIADGIMMHGTQMKSLLASAAQRSSQLQGYPLTMSAAESPQTKTEDESEEDDEVSRVNKVRAGLYDLASMLQFQNADKGI